MRGINAHFSKHPTYHHAHVLPVQVTGLFHAQRRASEYFGHAGRGWLVPSTTSAFSVTPFAYQLGNTSLLRRVGGELVALSHRRYSEGR